MYNQPFHNKDLDGYNFLVTGGAGFIGSHIVEYLLKYKAGKVIALDNLSTGFRQNIAPFFLYDNFEFIEGDVSRLDTCKEVCRNIDFVIHQAALGSVPRSINEPLRTNNTNVTGFINMLAAAKDCKVKRFIYASSSSVYGDSPELPKKENVIGKPLSPYAVSKRVDELYADVFAKTYNMEILGLRYFNIFGPRQSPEGPYAAAIPLFMLAVLKNEHPSIYGDGEQSRDFTFIENAVNANIKALFADNPKIFGQVFNIAFGQKYSVNELFNIICSITDSNIKAHYCEERPGDIRHSLADISMAKSLLGYNPSADIKKGLEVTFKWFKEKYTADIKN